jgi:hypothetical protein
MLAAVDLSPLGDAVRSEPSRGGQLFPHIHGVLPVDAVVSVWAAGANPRRGGEVARFAPMAVIPSGSRLLNADVRLAVVVAAQISDAGGKATVLGYCHLTGTGDGAHLVEAAQHDRKSTTA